MNNVAFGFGDLVKGGFVSIQEKAAAKFSFFVLIFIVFYKVVLSSSK